MKLRIALAALAVAGLSAVPARAEDPAPVRVLLTFGGHKFEEAPFFAMFDALPGVTYTKAPLPESADLLKPGRENQYDVVVRYDMVKAFTEEQDRQLTELLKRGIGLVSLHHNLGAHPDWVEYPRIIGGKFVRKTETLEGRTYEKTGYSHDEDIPVTIADREHPITRGVEPFTIHDETYGRFFVTSQAHVLLKTDHPECNPELAWTHRYGNSPVVYLMLGHDSKAWQNPAYPRLLLNAIRWAARNRPAPQTASR